MSFMATDNASILSGMVFSSLTSLILFILSSKKKALGGCGRFGLAGCQKPAGKSTTPSSLFFYLTAKLV